MMFIPRATCGPASVPPDSEYVQVVDGHLSVNGQRERYWAAIGKPYIAPALKPEDSDDQRAEKIALARKGTDRLVERLDALGFNAVRLWDAVPGTETYVIGDGSRADSVDYFIARAKARGFRIWLAGLNRTGDATSQDVAVLNDPATVEEWQSAFAAPPSETGAEKTSSPSKINLRASLSRVWDPRLEKLYLQRLEAIATHTNKHTGLRWSDDPVFAVWELANEEWWMRKMVGGQWQKEPKPFRKQLVARWNEWLRSKYGDDTKLAQAWGSLLPRESLMNSGILLAPMAGKVSAGSSLNDANELAKASVEGVAQSYSLQDFSAARAADVIEFFLAIQMEHKTKVAKALKGWGKSCRLSPVIFDTGIGYEAHSQFLHQNADAVAHDAYVNGWGPPYQEPDLAGVETEQKRMLKQLDAERISANSGPWVNWLLKPPGISQGVPWLEQNRVEGKPFLVYETQIQQPAKYRADFPLRIAALAAIQDWDWICWHYFSPGNDVGSVDRPFDKPLDVTTGRHPQGYHFTYDEVQNSTMRAAAHIFRQGLVRPAATPTKFIFGRNTLYAPESMVYAGSYGPTGMDMLQTTYQYGVRIFIDPRREEDEVIGPVVRFADRHTHNPYSPTEQITFDWKKGYLKLDAPQVAAFTGLLARYGAEVTFQNGVKLRDVTFNNPPEIFSPITEDERYLAFSLQTEDGRELAASKKASISLVSSSFNTGFSAPEGTFYRDGKIPERAIKQGILPVLTTRVGATVEAAGLEGMRYVFRDWHFHPIGEGRLDGPRLTMPDKLPIFYVELTRE